MLCSIHVGELNWTRRTDKEAEAPHLGQIWQAPTNADGTPGRIKAFGPGRRPTVLHRTEPDMVMPSYSGW